MEWRVACAYTAYCVHYKMHFLIIIYIHNIYVHVRLYYVYVYVNINIEIYIYFFFCCFLSNWDGAPPGSWCPKQTAYSAHRERRYCISGAP